jgi:hypothetical protein
MLPFAVTQYFRKVFLAPEVKVNEQVLVARKMGRGLPGVLEPTRLLLPVGC